MTQPSLLDQSADTMTDAVEAFFRDRPNVWVSPIEIAKLGCFCSWRTRVSDARKRFHREGGDIENRLEQYGTKKYSYYRYVPKETV